MIPGEPGVHCGGEAVVMSSLQTVVVHLFTRLGPLLVETFLKRGLSYWNLSKLRSLLVAPFHQTGASPSGTFPNLGASCPFLPEQNLAAPFH